MKNLIKIVILLNFILLIAPSVMFAGDTGKIIGRIVDEDKKPVVGATVLVVGTTRGAASDPDGKFNIIGVPIGTYSVKARAVGFKDVLITDVKISGDQTTSLEFEMSSDVINQIEVVIKGNRLVNPMATNTDKVIDKGAIESIPAAKDIGDVIKTQPGVVKQGNNYFLRGGRPNEVQYVVDGVPVNSIVGNSGELVGTTKANEQLSQLYAGTSSGSIGNGISSDAIASVNVQTSGFDADYGNAQSGIVNITTKSGGEKFTGSVKFRTDKMASTNQNEVYQSFTFGGPEPLSKYLLPGLGLKIPGTISFFLSADINRQDGAFTYDNNEFYNPVGRKIELDGFLGGLMNGLGFKFYDNQTNSFTFNSKLKYDIDWKDQISYSYRASLSTAHDYVNGWKLLADSSALSSKLSSQHTLAWTHFFNPKSLIKMNISQLELRDGNDVAGLKPPSYPVVINESSSSNDFDTNNDGLNDIGSSQRWYQADSRQTRLRFDYNGQVHPLHYLKTGFEVTYEEINSTEIVNPTNPLVYEGVTYYPPYPEFLDRSRGLYPGYGTKRWVIQNYPNNGTLYIQDNIEFQGLNLHVGLRYDYFDLGRQIYYDDFINRWNANINPDVGRSYDTLKQQWVEAQGRDENGKINNGRFLNDLTRFWYYFTHGNISPRLAIGYPVTERIVFYFNYGHFLQYPDRDNYYRDAPKGIEDWIGNPDLQPQKTISYEAGFQDQFTDDMSFAINAFYKDIFGYSTLVKRLGDTKVYQNLDYASVRGFEISGDQSFSGNFSAKLSYTYQLAKGRSSSSISSLFTNTNLPRETRLSFDQTHTVFLSLVYKVGYSEEGSFFNLFPLNNYTVSLTWGYGSGFPYTPYYAGSDAALQNQYLSNDATLPYTSNVDLSFSKGFLLFGKLNTSITLDITNLLNRRNITSGETGGGFNRFAGRPYIFGDYDPVTDILYRYSGMNSRVPPTIFSAPRQILLGVKINLD